MSSAATTKIDYFEISTGEDDFKIATEEEVFNRFEELEYGDGKIQVYPENMKFFKHLVSPEIYVSLDRRKNFFRQLNKIIKNEELLKQMRTLNVANFNKYYEDCFIKNIEYFNFAGEKHEKMGMCLVMHLYH